MKFGIILPNTSDYYDKTLLVETVRTAEENGFDSALVWDHYMLPYGDRTFEVWGLLSYLAALTRTIRLGTCVTPIPFRPPAILAKMVATLDDLSEGRVILGVGAGWHRPEFEGYSQWGDAGTRVAKTREGLKLMIDLWTKSSVDFEGKFYRAKGAVLDPKPRQKPYPQLWFGTRGERMLRLMVVQCHGWIPIGVSPKSYGNFVKKIRNMARGRPITMAYDADCYRESDKIVRLIEEYRAEGCEYFSMVWEYPRNEFAKRVKWFASEIIPSFA